MIEKELVCVNCPMGCRVTVQLEGDQVLSVRGHSCPRGKAYAEKECVRPERILTSTVKITGSTHPVLPVITDKEIPLDMVMQAMETVRSVTVKAPIQMGDVIIRDLLGTGADLVASRSMAKAN